MGRHLESVNEDSEKSVTQVVIREEKAHGFNSVHAEGPSPKNVASALRHLESQSKTHMTSRTKAAGKASQGQQKISRIKAKLVKKVSEKNKQKTKAKKRMGSPNSKVNNEVAIVNIQEALARHEETKSQKYMMEPGSTIGRMKNVSFHSDTFLVIILASTAIVMFAYLFYSCLKRGKLCPRGFLDNSDIRYRGRMRYRGRDEENMGMTSLMLYPDRFSPITNVGKLAAGIEIPVGPSAPEQLNTRQFSHTRPGGSEGFM